MRSVVYTSGPLSGGQYAVGDYSEIEEFPINVSRKTSYNYFLSNVSVYTKKKNVPSFAMVTRLPHRTGLIIFLFAAKKKAMKIQLLFVVQLVVPVFFVNTTISLMNHTA